MESVAAGPSCQRRLSPVMNLDRSARNLLLLTGATLVGLVVLAMVIRQVDPIEIVATLLFVPIFVGMVWFGLRGGLFPALLAALVYLWMRIPAIRLVGIQPLSALILGRMIGYLAFGVVGGWAAGVVGESLTKLALFDEIDDATRLHNARSLIAVIDRERSRIDRYASLFSAVHASFVTGPKDRRRLRTLGATIGAGVRMTDHATHFSTELRSHLMIILPDTGATGAATVTDNLETVLRSWGAVGLTLESMTVPGDETRLEAIEALARSTIAG